jgi:hypothetical protein
MSQPPGEIRAEIASVLRSGRQIAGALVCVALLALLFTMVNVTLFATGQGVPWWIAWLLDPMASITLGAMILAEGVLARYELGSGRWAVATKWFAGLATWAMNIWSSVVAGSAAGVLLHSVAPGLVLGLAEAAPWVRRQFAAVAAGLAQRLADVEDELTRERAAVLAEQDRAHREHQERIDAERRERLAEIEQERLERQALELARMEQEHQERLQAKAVTAPAQRQRGRVPARQVQRPAAPDLARLVELARPLVEQGLGRDAIRAELQTTAHWARKAVEAVRAEKRTPLHALPGGGR